jgi:hypothetical protein
MADYAPHLLKIADTTARATAGTILDDALATPTRGDLWPRRNTLRSSVGADGAAALDALLARFVGRSS